MKKFIVTFINFILFSSIIFSSEVTDLLENAKTAYSNGNLTETINLIDSAKRVVERETINSSSEEYIEVSNWDVVKLKQDFTVLILMGKPFILPLVFHAHMKTL